MVSFSAMTFASLPKAPGVSTPGYYRTPLRGEHRCSLLLPPLARRQDVGHQVAHLRVAQAGRTFPLEGRHGGVRPAVADRPGDPLGPGRLLEDGVAQRRRQLVAAVAAGAQLREQLA